MTTTCHVCHGTKLVPSMDSLLVWVEKGTPEDHTIEFKDAADEYINVRPGTVKIKVESLPHKVFTRIGNDLHMDIHLTLREALIGFEKTLRHLDGHEVDIERSGKVTKPDLVEKIENEGMPFSDYSGEYGNLVIKYIVDYPDSLTQAQS